MGVFLLENIDYISTTPPSIRPAHHPICKAVEAGVDTRNLQTFQAHHGHI
jgi:hypothetical protein